MSNFLVAFILLVIAFALLGISWLLTGKLSIKPGACGRDPNKARGEECGKKITCGLCKKGKEDDEDVQTE